MAVALLGLSAAMAIRVLLTGPAAIDGSLSPDSTMYDFGTVGLIGLQHTFVLENRCAGAIQILYATTGCGCTAVHVPARKLERGESVRLDCSIDTTGRRGKLDTHVSVTYKELSVPSRERRLTCLLSGVIRAGVDVDPQELTFQISRSETKVLHIVAADAKASIVSATSDHRAIHMDVIDSGRTVRVSFDKSLWQIPPGSVWILLTTSPMPDGVLRVPVRLTDSSVNSTPTS